jgi:putative transposase
MLIALVVMLHRRGSRLLQALRSRFLTSTHPLTRAQAIDVLGDLLRSKRELVAENALLRQQLIVLRRHTKRPCPGYMPGLSGPMLAYGRYAARR